MHQIPRTRGWTATTISGPPDGAHTAVPAWITSGTPADLTLVVPVTHWAVTQGGRLPGVQPVTSQGAVSTAVGWPPTVTLGFKTAGRAWAACWHSVTAPS
ncbi:hypothetical protein ABT040_29815 [Streptomyces sp. NPDC002688]|uniref:hypothetical protein n=1 Tax=Streptomyces sp. NPDC002688 TaxID=3154423 RepID=UPI00332A288C